MVTSSGDQVGNQLTARAEDLAIVIADPGPATPLDLEGPARPSSVDADESEPLPAIIDTMAKDRTGEDIGDVDDSDVAHRRVCTGWKTPHDSDAPVPCPRCHDMRTIRRRPVREYHDPVPSARAAAAYAAAGDDEETARDRPRPVECPVTMPNETGT